MPNLTDFERARLCDLEALLERCAHARMNCADVIDELEKAGFQPALTGAKTAQTGVMQYAPDCGLLFCLGDWAHIGLRIYVRLSEKK